MQANSIVCTGVIRGLNTIYGSNLVIGTLKSGTTLGIHATVFGDDNEASNFYDHAEGYQTTASGGASHAEGFQTTASNSYAHAEGIQTTASNSATHAEGNHTTASGQDSHAEGNGTTANDSYAHAEGNGTTASAYGAHAEGLQTIADGNYSHTEGYGSTTTGVASHAEGDHTTAKYRSQHVFGEYNIVDPSTVPDTTRRGTYVEIVGNGTSSTRANARTLNWNGNEWIKGTLTQGSSIEIKKNVADMTQEDGDKILNLRPVVFDYKSSEKDIQAERGFIAEEVSEIIPNLVTDKIVNDEGETVAPASLNYIAMIPYLVKVCQRQQKEIDGLKAALKSK